MASASTTATNPYTDAEVTDMLDEVRDLAEEMYPDLDQRRKFLDDLDDELNAHKDDLQEQGLILQDMLDFCDEFLEKKSAAGGGSDAYSEYGDDGRGRNAAAELPGLRREAGRCVPEEDR